MLNFRVRREGCRRYAAPCERQIAPRRILIVTMSFTSFLMMPPV